MVVMLMYMTKLYIQYNTKLVDKGLSHASFQNRDIATIGKSSEVLRSYSS